MHVNGQREEEAGVPAVDELVRPELNKVGKLGVAGSDNPVDLGFDLQPLLVGVGAVVLAQPRLALTVLQQDELEHACAAPAIADSELCRLCFLHRRLPQPISPQCAVSVLPEPSRACPIYRFSDIIAAEQVFETKHSHLIL